MQIRRPDGIEPLTFSGPTGLKPALWTTRGQGGTSLGGRSLRLVNGRRHITSMKCSVAQYRRINLSTASMSAYVNLFRHRVTPDKSTSPEPKRIIVTPPVPLGDAERTQSTPSPDPEAVELVNLPHL